MATFRGQNACRCMGTNGPDRKEPHFSGSVSDGAPRSHVGEYPHSEKSPVGAAHPDPLFYRILQVDRIRQGVGGS
jgi:hypothetical protein